MIRWLGAALLLMGSSALGEGAAARLRGRVRDIQGLTAGLEAMARTLSASLAPLDEMLQAAEACTGQRPAQFFHTCRRELLTLGGILFPAYGTRRCGKRLYVWTRETGLF